jgi:hypothetical protein
LVEVFADLRKVILDFPNIITFPQDWELLSPIQAVNKGVLIVRI